MLSVELSIVWLKIWLACARMRLRIFDRCMGAFINRMVTVLDLHRPHHQPGDVLSVRGREHERFAGMDHYFTLLVRSIV
jgi:hypothetical protein